MKKKVELEPVQVQKWDYGSFRLDKLEICVAKKYSDIGLRGRGVFLLVRCVSVSVFCGQRGGILVGFRFCGARLNRSQLAFSFSQ